MDRNLGNLALALPARAAGTHVLAHTREVSVADCVCNMHARSPITEHTYRRTAIAVILRGSFHVRAREGEAVVGPGALLLKNAGGAHEYRHVDDGGDRSITFELEDAFSDSSIRPFEHVCIPASARTAATVALVERALAEGGVALHDAALAVTAIAAAADREPTRAPSPAPAQAWRIARVLRYVDEHPTRDCSLDALAELAGLSTFHFARAFRALVNQTPHQYVIAVRLRTAAHALTSTRKPIIEVALDAGFSDLSHFTTSFRRAFGVSPRRYRLAKR